MTTADKVLDLAKEGLSLWKTFIATRQEAYNRKRDKNQVNAIESSEKLIFEVDNLIDIIRMKYPEDMKEQPIKGALGQIAHFRKRFFKYN